MIRFQEKDQLDWSVEDFISALAKEISIRESHIPLKSAHVHSAGTYDKRRPHQMSPDVGTANALLTTNNKKCVYCLGDHPPEGCITVSTVEERKNVLKKYAKCFLCLNTGHRVFTCRSKLNCKTCKGRHHLSICQAANKSCQASARNAQASVGSTPLNPSATSWVGNTGSGTKVALQTALENVNALRGGKVRVLFDTGSQRSFITAKAREGLRPVKSEKLGIKAFGSSEAEVADREVYEFTLHPLKGGQGVRVECFIVDNISSITNEHVEVIKYHYEHLSKVYFSDVCKNLEMLPVDVLIGSNFLWDFQQGETIRGGPHEPVAVKTTLGWVLSGPLKGKFTAEANDANVNFVIDSRRQEVKQIDEEVHKLWDLDSLGIREGNNVHEQLIDDISFTGTNYSVRLPWKIGHKDLTSNYDISLARLTGLLRKLRKEPYILEKYDDIINEQFQSGIIQKVTQLETAERVHYLAHRAVIREEAETTKVRIVFDASCRQSKHSTSLNDCLHVGPSLTPLIFDILLRFRSYKTALVGDIEKAFLNIEIDPIDRDCLRFLWVSDIKSENPDIIVYKYNTVVFGVNSSPFILNAVLRHHIESFASHDPEFTSKVVQSFYVDDLVSGGQNTEETFGLYKKVKERLQVGGFKLRKWKTNDRMLKEKIEQSENEKGKEIETQNISFSSEDSSFSKESLGLPEDKEKATKVLGIF